WSEKLRRSAYDFDEESLRPWFSIDRVVSGMFQLAESLFGLSIKARPTYVGDPVAGQSNGVEVWHEQVGYYDVFDRESGALLGGFFTDWYPRESKRSGAWMDTIREGRWGASAPLKPHLDVLCGNLTPPDAEGKSLLTHDEVTTIFHEFGHLLHQICGRVPIRSLNGISVAWDFVEVPSQLMENWCWERESLDLFARHQSSGEPIPDELFTKMMAARNFQEGLGILRQLALGILDLDLHMFYIGPNGTPVEDLDSFAEKAIAAFRPPLKTQSPPIHRNFGHLFGGGGGYAAGYYSYKWSEVLEADAFESFKANGVLSADTGRRLRDSILSVGKSIEPMDAFVRFRGRMPSLAPYLKRSGLLDEAAIRASDPSRFEFG
ncbi:MAG: M3 family peptidase, partial [Opitutales bacterium]|nr:M3 family peptidase [Opitutales bacterium]